MKNNGNWFRDTFGKVRDNLRRKASGRYGTDSLNRALLIAALVLILLSWLGSRAASWLSIFSVLAWVPLIWSLTRSYSRNIEARQRENAAWLRFKARLRDTKHRYFSCPKCGQQVRVPRGRGKISIRCPKCDERFIKKT